MLVFNVKLRKETNFNIIALWDEQDSSFTLDAYMTPDFYDRAEDLYLLPRKRKEFFNSLACYVKNEKWKPHEPHNANHSQNQWKLLNYTPAHPPISMMNGP